MVSAVKATLGMMAFYMNFMFINRLCLIIEPNQCPAELDMSVPNALVAFSLLLSLGSCHFMDIVFCQHTMPAWVSNILDALVSMYLTELIIRQFWIPLLDLAYWMCNRFANCLQDLSNGAFSHSLIDPVAGWLRTDAMHSIQMAIALAFVCIMLYVTGTIEFCQHIYFNQFGRAPGDDGDSRWRYSEDSGSFGLPEKCPKLQSIMKNSQQGGYEKTFKLLRKPSERSVSFMT